MLKGLNASECLALNTAKHVDEVEKKERKIIRKILGPKYEDGKGNREATRRSTQKQKK